MGIVCPNTSHPDWKASTKHMSGLQAYTLFEMNGYKLPNSGVGFATKFSNNTAYPHTVIKQGDTVYKQSSLNISKYIDNSLNSDGKYHYITTVANDLIDKSTIKEKSLAKEIVAYRSFHQVFPDPKSFIAHLKNRGLTNESIARLSEAMNDFVNFTKTTANKFIAKVHKIVNKATAKARNFKAKTVDYSQKLEAKMSDVFGVKLDFGAKTLPSNQNTDVMSKTLYEGFTLLEPIYKLIEGINIKENISKNIKGTEIALQEIKRIIRLNLDYAHQTVALEAISLNSTFQDLYNILSNKVSYNYSLYVNYLTKYAHEIKNKLTTTDIAYIARETGLRFTPKIDAAFLNQLFKSDYIHGLTLKLSPLKAKLSQIFKTNAPLTFQEFNSFLNKLQRFKEVTIPKNLRLVYETLNNSLLNPVNLRMQFISPSKEVTSEYTHKIFDKLLGKLQKMFPNITVEKINDPSLPPAFLSEGVVYINEGATLTLDKPAHEFAHVWFAAIKQSNPTMYQQLLESALREPEFLNSIKQLYGTTYENNDDILEEAIVTILGQQLTSKLMNNSFIQTLKENILSAFYEIFGISNFSYQSNNLSADLKPIINELLKGNDISSYEVAAINSIIFYSKIPVVTGFSEFADHFTSTEAADEFADLHHIYPLLDRQASPFSSTETVGDVLKAGKAYQGQTPPHPLTTKEEQAKFLQKILKDKVAKDKKQITNAIASFIMSGEGVGINALNKYIKEGTDQAKIFALRIMYAGFKYLDEANDIIFTMDMLNSTADEVKNYFKNKGMTDDVIELFKSDMFNNSNFLIKYNKKTKEVEIINITDQTFLEKKKAGKFLDFIGKNNRGRSLINRVGKFVNQVGIGVDIISSTKNVMATESIMYSAVIKNKFKLKNLKVKVVGFNNITTKYEEDSETAKDLALDVKQKFNIQGVNPNAFFKFLNFIAQNKILNSLLPKEVLDAISDNENLKYDYNEFSTIRHYAQQIFGSVTNEIHEMLDNEYQSIFQGPYRSSTYRSVTIERLTSIIKDLLQEYDIQNPTDAAEVHDKIMRSGNPNKYKDYKQFMLLNEAYIMLRTMNKLDINKNTSTGSIEQYYTSYLENRNPAFAAFLEYFYEKRAAWRAQFTEWNGKPKEHKKGTHNYYTRNLIQDYEDNEAGGFDLTGSIFNDNTKYYAPLFKYEEMVHYNEKGEKTIVKINTRRLLNDSDSEWKNLRPAQKEYIQFAIESYRKSFLAVAEKRGFNMDKALEQWENSLLGQGYIPAYQASKDTLTSQLYIGEMVANTIDRLMYENPLFEKEETNEFNKFPNQFFRFAYMSKEEYETMLGIETINGTRVLAKDYSKKQKNMEINLRVVTDKTVITTLMESNFQDLHVVWNSLLSYLAAHSKTESISKDAESRNNDIKILETFVKQRIHNEAMSLKGSGEKLLGTIVSLASMITVTSAISLSARTTIVNMTVAKLRTFNMLFSEMLGHEFKYSEEASRGHWLEGERLATLALSGASEGKKLLEMGLKYGLLAANDFDYYNSVYIQAHKKTLLESERLMLFEQLNDLQMKLSVLYMISKMDGTYDASEFDENGILWYYPEKNKIRPKTIDTFIMNENIRSTRDNASGFSESFKVDKSNGKVRMTAAYDGRIQKTIERSMARIIGGYTDTTKTVASSTIVGKAVGTLRQYMYETIDRMMGEGHYSYALSKYETKTEIINGEEKEFVENTLTFQEGLLRSFVGMSAKVLGKFTGHHTGDLLDLTNDEKKALSSILLSMAMTAALIVAYGFTEKKLKEMTPEERAKYNVSLKMLNSIIQDVSILENMGSAAKVTMNPFISITYIAQLISATGMVIASEDRKMQGLTKIINMLGPIKTADFFTGYAIISANVEIANKVEKDIRMIKNRIEEDPENKNNKKAKSNIENVRQNMEADIRAGAGYFNIMHKYLPYYSKEKE